jgi:type VI secretion system secreted protein VgrG
MAGQLDVSFRCDALGDGFLVVAASVTEGLSQPTFATVQLLSTADLDGTSALDTPADIEVTLDGEPLRDFHMVVTGVSFDGMMDGTRRKYTVVLAHELHLLTLRTDTRMFQEKTAVDIVKAVLEGAGLDMGNYAFRLERAPGKRTYCVQYGESDFDFVSRLLEHEGIHYSIRHEGGSAKVTFGDAQTVFERVPGTSTFHVMDDDQHGDGLRELVIESHVMSARASVGDHNFEHPDVDLTKSHDAEAGHTGDRYEYPGGHRLPDEGATLARLRLEELLARSVVLRGKSEQPAFTAGATFEVENAAVASHDGEYLLTTVEHHFHPSAHRAPGEPAYENDLTAIPFSHTYRPARQAPVPRIRGLQSVVVTGPSGSEIHTDAHGRMKGKFFWDRLGKEDATSSTWMRVVQFPVGGSMALARVGWEMEVAYIDGDPDRPVGVARFYTAEKTSPYAYPAAKTRMSFQTPSSPGGGKSNEIRMEDGGGSMELFVNASKDHDEQTNNNKTEKVGVDEKIEVGVDQAITVASKQTIDIGGSLSTTVSGDAGLQVKTSRTKTVGGSESITVSGNISTTVDGSDSETTGGSHTTMAALGVSKSSTGSYSLTVGGSMVSASGLGVNVAVLGAKSETIGGVKLTASGGPVTNTVIGAYAGTVGGVQVQAAAGNRNGSTKGASALTVGGAVLANAGGKLTIKAKSKVRIRVAGLVNLLGGGGILNMTPGSIAFVGMVTLDASGSIKISGNPNLMT